MIAALLLLLASPPAEESRPSQSAVLSFPIADMPDLAEGAYGFPTWGQSIQLTKSQYQASHRLIAEYAHRKFDGDEKQVAGATISAGLLHELAVGWLPLARAWAHEEGHRSVMDRRGVDSFNDVYLLNPFRSAIYVSHVRDADLVRLKDEHPADQVRLAAAGWETEWVLTRELEKEAFFLDAPVWLDWATLISNATSTVGYLWVCSEPVFDRFTDESNEADGRSVPKRDALGLDCTAWVYDLHRPDEPYAARGEHPSGVGVDRYIKFGDLSADEQRLMRKVRWLSLLTFADPFLFLQPELISGERRATSRFAFFATSYGYTIDQDFFVSQRRVNVLFTWHHQFNEDRYFPGFDLELWRHPLPFGRRPAYVTVGASAWLQPANQRWDDGEHARGGRMWAGLAVPVWDRMELQLEGATKSRGWVAGDAHLDAETSFRAGLGWRWR